MLPAFNIVYFLFLILMTICISKVTLHSNCSNNTIFYLLSIIILNCSLVIFWYYFYNLAVCLIFSLILIVMTFAFLLELKIEYEQSIKLCLPYFILTIYVFAYIINQFLCLAHQ